SHDLAAQRKTLTSFLRLINSTIGDIYLDSYGETWKKDKIIELQEDNLVYVYYTVHTNPRNKNRNCNQNTTIVGFLSFKLVFNQFDKNNLYYYFYLFEIHINPNYQNSKLGSILIDKYHSLANLLNGNPQLKSLLQLKKNYRIKKYYLSVFSKNFIAINWYINKLNYKKLSKNDFGSNELLTVPEDKILRNGKIIKPIYYIL
ncbi:GNAT family N-acetyltransferase ASCRUDRAFT_17576, partial [Ascoidea rubescens DSM 1968]